MKLSRNLNLKDIPPDLYKRFRLACMEAGQTVRETILQLMAEFVARKGGKDNG